MNADQLSNLEKSIHKLNTELKKLASEDELQSLIKIIHRPGWTTVAEATLVAGIVEAMTNKTVALGQLKATLLKGAGEVGAK